MNPPPSWTQTPPIEETRRGILALNPDHDHRDLLSTPTWDIRNYERRNVPMVVGAIPEDLRAGFSAQRGDRAQDLCVKMPGQGWQLPEAYAPYEGALRVALAAERAVNADFRDCEGDYYAYITVDQKRVQPHLTQRRQGFHGDAFLTPEIADLSTSVLTENTYLVFDGLPTEFKAGPFRIDDVYPDDAACLARFDEAAAGMPTITMPPYAVVRITPFHVHSPSVNRSDEPVARTFVKITFSRERFNRTGNAMNPLLSYDGWIWVSRRDSIRNHRSILLDWNRPDAEDYLAVQDPSRLDPAWCDLRVFWAYKVEGVRADQARPRAQLETRVEGFGMSVGIAQEGDWLITTRGGDQYFLSDAKFRARYHAEPAHGDVYLPKPDPLPMVRITAPIRFRAPWGAMQYAPAGSVLVLKQGDVYAIHESSFARAYRKVGDPEQADLAGLVINVVREQVERGAERLRMHRGVGRKTARRKADGTLVCSLDYEVQRRIVEALLGSPVLAGHVYVLGEENFAEAGISQALIDQNKMAFGSAEFIVAVDPLDNSRGYAEQDTPLYATVAAVLRRGSPIYYLAIAPEMGDRYEAMAPGLGDLCSVQEGVRYNGDRPPAFRASLGSVDRVLAAGLHWVTPPDPLRDRLRDVFYVQDRFGSFQLVAARMVLRDPRNSCDAVITSGFPYHETIPAAALLCLAGAPAARPNGLSFFPLQWSDLAGRVPHQLIAGSTQAVNRLRQLRAEHPMPR